jgi:hypothetical protein
MLVLSFLKIGYLGGLQYFRILHLKMHEITSHISIFLAFKNTTNF